MTQPRRDRRPAALRVLAAAVLVVDVVLLGGRTWAGGASEPPGLGPSSAGLGACPANVACVSSQDLPPVAVAPLAPQQCGSAVRFVYAQAVQVLATAPRTTLQVADEQYAHALRRSAVLGVIHDVEVFADPVVGVVQVRVIARRGGSADGVRRVVEQVRAELAAACATAP